MKVHKVVLMILDFDELGQQEIIDVIEHQNYPNDCISPTVVDISSVEIGEWEDSHPLNTAENKKYFKTLFDSESVAQQQPIVNVLLVEQASGPEELAAKIQLATEKALKNLRSDRGSTPQT